MFVRDQMGEIILIRQARRRQVSKLSDMIRFASQILMVIKGLCQKWIVTSPDCERHCSIMSPLAPLRKIVIVVYQLKCFLSILFRIPFPHRSSHRDSSKNQTQAGRGRQETYISLWEEDCIKERQSIVSVSIAAMGFL